MTRIAAALALALWALCALAQQGSLQTTYRCVGKDGKKYYGSTIPRQCIGQPVEQLSSQGTVLRRIAPTAEETDEEREAKEAAAAKKREADKEAKEQERRNRALLATYTSEKDIEDARGRAIAENEKAVKAVEVRIAEIKKRQAGFEKEMEFYKEPAAKPGDKSAKKAEPKKPAPKAPPKLLEDMHQAEVDLAAQQNLLETKKKEVEAINAKYDEDKKRYLDLTKPARKK
jgi:hypothetical protein